MRSQATYGTGVWFIFSTGYGPNGLPASSNIFQRFAASSSIFKHESERHWCFIEGWHVCACVCVCVVVLFYVANHLHFLLCARHSPSSSDCTLLVCFFSFCRFYQRGASEVLIWLLQATPAATPAGSFGGVACLQARHTWCKLHVITVLDPNIRLAPKRSRKLEPKSNPVQWFYTMTHNVSDGKPVRIVETHLHGVMFIAAEWHLSPFQPWLVVTCC